MEPEGNIDVWYMLFQQTPIALRWAFTVVTGGLFALAAVLYRRQKSQQERIERQLHARVDRLERRIDKRMDQMARLLTEIAANTRKGEGPEVDGHRDDE